MSNFTLEQIKSLTFEDIEGTKYYRVVSKKHKNEILDVQGSYMFGGRYNPTQEFGALYLGETLEVSKREKEIQAKDKKYLEEMVGGEIEVFIKKIINLCKKENLKKLSITEEELVKPQKNGGYILTWNIARMCYNSEIKAILAPSRTSKGAILVIFDKYVKESYLKICKKFSVSFLID